MKIRDVVWNPGEVEHLWQSHRVRPDEVEEILFGCDDDGPLYRIVREGDFFVIFGETGDGRLLTVVGEPVGAGTLRPFAARDMSADEKRAFRRGRR